jgi:hypothetical protein
LTFLSLIVAGRRQKDEAFLRELPEHTEKLHILSAELSVNSTRKAVDFNYPESLLASQSLERVG